MANEQSGGFHDGENQHVHSPGEPRIVGHERVATWAEETRRYRRNVGGWWWLAFLGVPAVIAAAGLSLGGSNDAPSSGGTGAASSSASASSTSGGTSTSTSQGTATGSGAQPTASGGASGVAASEAFAITRTGAAVTVRAVVPNEDAKAELIASVKSALGVADVTDKVSVSAAATGPAAAAVGSALGALKEAGDFGLAWDLKTLVATGVVPTAEAKASLGSALGAAWPGVTVSNGVSVGNDAAAACANLGDAIKVALADTKITFVKYGTDPNAESVTVLKKVAAMAGKCPNAKLTVTGYTDASGTPGENQRLSEERAQAVRAVLVGSGVASAQVTATGKGEASPIASNDTPAGIAANRRVEITVS